MKTRPGILLAAIAVVLCALTACQQQSHQKDSVMESYDDSTVATLLNKAQIAFDKNQLTTPEHDNALYFYQKVLAINPKQTQALSGREAIFDRYLDFARAAYTAHDYPKALVMVDKAETILLPSRMSKGLRQQILDTQAKAAAEAKAAKKPAPKPAVAESKGIEYLLSMKGLSEKDDGMRARLKLIAEHARELKNSILIVARTDAEGRWVYQQMKEAVPDYHLRGDIHIGEHPKVVLLEMAE